MWLKRQKRNLCSVGIFCVVPLHHTAPTFLTKGWPKPVVTEESLEKPSLQKKGLQKKSRAERDRRKKAKSGWTRRDKQPRPKKPKPTEPVEFTIAMVKERAYRLLAIREHGFLELKNKLLQREMPADLVDSVVDNLAAEGLQCDVRFAESYLRMRIERGYGMNKVRADLQGRHIDRSTIEAALRDSEANWHDIALKALQKKFAKSDYVGPGIVDYTAVDQTAHDTSRAAVAKMQRYLYSRGFDMQEIQSALIAMGYT